MSDGPFENTDRELWREIEGDAYAPSVHVTKDGGIGINVGGTVYVKPLRAWHALASMVAPLAWDANDNRHYDPVERLAAEIYDTFPYVNARGEPMPGTKPKWTPHGNGLKLDEARALARKQLRAAGHTPALLGRDRACP